MNPRIAIIGGGPAGCSAARALGRLGLSSTMFEAGARFRDKPCGDALVSQAVERLAGFGLSPEHLACLGGVPFHEVTLSASGSPTVSTRMPHPGGWVVPRAQLDQALRDAVSASCEIRYRSVVARVAGDSVGVGIETAGSSPDIMRFDAAILATGANAKLAAHLGVDGIPLRAVSFRSYVREELAAALAIEFTSSRPREYVWAFPIARGSNVGVWRVADGSPAMVREVLIAQLTRIGRGRQAPLRGGIGTLWSGRARRWHNGPIVSCGDSAGVVDPLSGEGISAALLTGEWAGEAVGQYVLNDHDPRALDDYSDRVVACFSHRYAPDRFRDMFEAVAGAADRGRPPASLPEVAVERCDRGVR